VRTVAYEINDECVACGTCAEECPADAIDEGEDKYVIKQDTCTECGTCMEVCPVDAVVEV
jgi:NAD-dependent dihydropyrimidine dehydrogenase PreA subunit